MSIELEDSARKFLESSVKNFKIFIDTGSLLDSNADKFWANIVPILDREKKHVIIPYRVYQEVERFADDASRCVGKEPGLHQRAIKAQKTIVRLQKAGAVKIQGEKNDTFADNLFQTLFTKFCLQHNLMLITTDKKLAKDILGIKQRKSVNTNKKILVERINSDGFLTLLLKNTPTSTENGRSSRSSSQPAPRTRGQNISEGERFALATKVTKIPGDLKVSVMPGEADEVIAKRGGQEKRVRLLKQLSAGGEGVIYDTNVSGRVAKIYKKEKLTRAKYEKLRLMQTKSIQCEGVCFPTALLYNTKNEFVGYLMQKARGKELQKCVFIPALLKKLHPDWKKPDTVQLCITILKKMKYLHDRNVILGDINPNNILVESPTEVYFVDTDSYQIEGFPCPVGMINFTAPEIQRKKFDTFLRTMGNEKFAVATLLFMIMLPGKPPYDLQGGEDQVENIINGDFAYPSGSRRTGKAPEGPWRFCWSHLPRYLKDDFYETFRKGCKHSTEQTRYSTDDWLKKFEYYHDLLTSGKLAGQDEMSMELFPTRLKNNSATSKEEREEKDETTPMPVSVGNVVKVLLENIKNLF
jgi:serine/threonine protein kinase